MSNEIYSRDYIKKSVENIVKTLIINDKKYSTALGVRLRDEENIKRIVDFIYTEANKKGTISYSLCNYIDKLNELSTLVAPKIKLDKALGSDSFINLSLDIYSSHDDLARHYDFLRQNKDSLDPLVKQLCKIPSDTLRLFYEENSSFSMSKKYIDEHTYPTYVNHMMNISLKELIKIFIFHQQTEYLFTDEKGKRFSTQINSAKPEWSIAEEDKYKGESTTERYFGDSTSVALIYFLLNCSVWINLFYTFPIETVRDIILYRSSIEKTW